ncbi:MAG: family 16 glycosylhydrolase [Flavobacterium sp.]|nr:family 16 glycosylhydrolase [Flavobacterium sp.]
MKHTNLFKILFIFIVTSQICLAQVDVVYKDLVWSDEFETNGAINSTKWHHQTQLPANGSWYNGEVQHYTNQLANSFVSSGNLNIVAKKESYTDQGVNKEYTSARLNSKFAFKYGRVEVRAKLPTGVGTWPAIWTLGKNINEPGGYFYPTHGSKNWPACGEIDIMEHWGSNQNYIQSAMHTPSSFGGTVNYGGQTIPTASSDFHIYTLVWTAEKMDFFVDGVKHYTYNPSVKNASTWPFDAEQYLLLNVAIQNIISSSFTQSAMEIDYVRVYQNTTPDTQKPTNFTASVGTIAGSAVELLLNANDDSGNVTYNVTYGANGTATTFGSSGVQKSFVISGLSPNTDYSFTVSASDASGNTFTGNPILLNAKTTVVIDCSGTDSQAQQGSFSTGYKYSFETIGTSVKFTFEMLDTDKTGVSNAYLWRQSPFAEFGMGAPISGKIFTKTLDGFSPGSVISYACKFEFSGGLAVTKYLSYTVGNSCSLGVETVSDFPQVYYPNPVENKLNLQLNDNQNQISLTDVLGRILFKEVVNSNFIIDMSDYPPGLYLLKVKNSKGIQESKILKK